MRIFSIIVTLIFLFGCDEKPEVIKLKSIIADINNQIDSLKLEVLTEKILLDSLKVRQLWQIDSVKYAIDSGLKIFDSTITSIAVNKYNIFDKFLDKANYWKTRRSIQLDKIENATDDQNYVNRIDSIKLWTNIFQYSKDSIDYYLNMAKIAQLGINSFKEDSARLISEITGQLEKFIENCEANQKTLLQIIRNKEDMIEIKKELLRKLSDSLEIIK